MTVPNIYLTEVAPNHESSIANSALKIHLMNKELGPAWGKRCSVCGKMNHWKGSEIRERKAKFNR